MCGIAGIFEFDGRPVDRDLLKRMTDTLAHRGPDGDGFYVHDGQSGDPSCGLGHRRLSIIDLSPVRHPLSNEDGTVRVMVNGEFYGYLDDRRELLERGHAMATECDSENLCHLYEELGVEAVKRLRGMFALAIWDEPRGRLILARDRFGQKPIFYTRVGDRLLFGSELKALFQDPSLERRLNLAGLSAYLTNLYLTGSDSLAQGVKRLLPGHMLIVDRDGIREERYWRPGYDPQPMDEEEATREFERLLTEAVELRLISDAPLGAFLSGGIDSSVICALINELMSGGQRPRTFTVSFGETSFDESAKARKVAEYLGTDHTEVPVRPDLMADLDFLLDFIDEPMADSSAIPTFWLCRATRQHVTVALSGDAGDELLAGYRRYVGRRMAERYNRLPGLVRGLNSGLARLLPDPETYSGRSFIKKFKMFVDLAEQARKRPDSSRIDFLNPSELAALLGPRAVAPDGPDRYAELFAQLPDGDPVARMQWVDLQTYLVDDILVKVDRMSMAHGLEVRSPFLDHHLTEFLEKVPVELKLKGLTTKYLLKKIARKRLDPAIIDQPKQGFEVPLAAWFKNELRGVITEVAEGSVLERAELLSPGAIRTILDQHLSGRKDRAQLLWALLVLESWLKRYHVEVG